MAVASSALFVFLCSYAKRTEANVESQRSK